MTEEQNSYSAPEPSVALPNQEMASTEGSSSNEPGQGRRRRRRKRKGTRAAAPNGQNGQQVQPQPQGQNGQSQNASPQPSQNNGSNGQPQGQKSGKRFFRKARNNQGGQGNGQGGGYSQQANPGNGNGNGGGQGRRRNGKQRRQPAAFVGPMDHSYRIANGNIADGPPSTIMLQNGNGYGNGYSSHGNGYSNGNVNGNLIGYGQSYPADTPVVPMREDAPTRIYCYIEDLFFLAKIQETSRKLGIKVEFVKADRELLAELLELPEESRPGLIVFDLNNLNAKPLTLIPKFRSKLKKTTSIVGFVSHLQGDLKMKATEAGCDAVMPRSAFSQNLPNLLRRYGLDEVEEDDAQPF
jgi:hypothetical protein